MTERDPRPHADTPDTTEPVDPADPVEEASQESFPASDAPSWEPLHSGAPPREQDSASDPGGSDAPTPPG